MGQVISKATLRAGSWAVLIGLVALLVAAVVVPGSTGASTYTVLTGSMRAGAGRPAPVVVRPADGPRRHRRRLGDHLPARVGQAGGGDPPGRRAGRATSTSSRCSAPRGTRTARPDAIWVRPDQVRGTVWYSMPYVGYLEQNDPGHASREVIVVLSGGVLLGYAVRDVLDRRSRDRRRVSHA